MTTVDLAEYAICERRGHEPSGVGITEGAGWSWSYCRWCNARYRIGEPEMIVHPADVPEEPMDFPPHFYGTGGRLSPPVCCGFEFEGYCCIREEDHPLHIESDQT